MIKMDGVTIFRIGSPWWNTGGETKHENLQVEFAHPKDAYFFQAMQQSPDRKEGKNGKK